jgi:hypothetical protein
MIKINNIQQFNSTFLSLLSKVCDNVCLKVDKDKIYSITSSNDNTIVIFSTFKQDNTDNNEYNLNIPDISRMMRILGCVSADNIELDVDSNCIQYKSPEMRFKYHLLEDGIITVPAVSIEKIKKLEFKYSFDITKSDVLSLIKGSSLVTDVDKLYFSVENSHVFAEITDKESSNTDSFSHRVASEYAGDGEFNQMSINFEILRIISGLRFDKIKVRINTDVNVLLFETAIDKVKHNFICTTYVR